MKSLAELMAAGLPKATCESLGIQITPKDDSSEAKVDAEVAIAKFDEYLSGFLIPTDGGKCVKCGTVQGGLAASIMGTGFQYGYVHGEGACGTCGYPGRTYHQVDGVGTLSDFILQYHPDALEEQPAPSEAESA